MSDSEERGNLRQFARRNRARRAEENTENTALRTPEEQNGTLEDQSETPTGESPNGGADAQSRRTKFLDRRTKRRQDIEGPKQTWTPRSRKVFEPQPVVELLRGRYRAVWKEMRRTLSETSRFVHRYEPDESLSQDPDDDRDIDFESMMREAVEEFEREGRQVDDNPSRT